MTNIKPLANGEEEMSREESDGLFELYDTEADGTLDMSELIDMIADAKQKEGSQLDKAKIQQVWDADGDGTVCC